MDGNDVQTKRIVDEVGKSIIAQLVADGRLSKPKDEHWYKNPLVGWVVAAVGFLSLTIFDDVRGEGGKNSAMLQEVEIRLATIEATLTTLAEQARAAGADRYTSNDARRDAQAQALRDERQNARIDKLEAK